MRVLENGYVKTAAMAMVVIGDTPFFLVDYVLRLLRVVVLVSLWRAILLDHAASGPMPLATVLTYTLVAEVFSEQLNARTTLNEAFWQGTLVIRFLRPMGLIRQLAAEMVGTWVVDVVLFSIPLFAVAPLLGVDPRPATPVAGALFVLSLCAAVLVGLAMELVFGACVVALDQPVWLIEWIRAAIATLLSGALLPLAYYPWGVGDVFAWLPFAAMAWAPLAIYTGVGEPISLLLRQIAWGAVLWQVGTWLWRSNREKLVAYGG